jgi:NAD(P)H-nitrite reductase large subunit
MTHYLIIGSGAAGISAAETIRRLDAGGEITLVSEERDGYYSRPGLAYLLTGEIPEAQLYPFAKQDFHRLGLHLVNTRAGQILPQQKEVIFQNGRRLRYDRLLIATGAQAVMARLPGAELRGVVKLDTLDETRRILNLARKARQAVVVGGGITALELVEGLRSRGVKVNYFLRGDRYWSNVLDETESRIVEQRLKEEGVTIHTHTELAEILGKDGRVVGVQTTDGRQVRCDLVGMAIGVSPRKELGEAAGLKLDKGILVDETMHTSIPDIYAAGDVAQVYDPRIGRAIVDSLWEPARAQGRTAGMNMAGQFTEYMKVVAFNVTRLAGLTTTIIGSVGIGRGDPDVVGIVRGDSEGWRHLPDGMAVQSRCEVNRLRLLLGEQNLIGGVIMGDQTLSRAVHQLVVKQVDIRPIRQKLLHPEAPIEAILSGFSTGQEITEAM